MAARNINKIVQSNINLKPWMLSKNTNQIVNNYIQQIYKQVPTNFRRDNKKNKVSTPRPENRGPLSTFKNQEKQAPTISITPRRAIDKKSHSRLKQQTNFLNSLKISNKNNQEMSTKLAGANLTVSKRNLKTPNYKIYKALRYGSSSSSSRSSLFKRYDDRRRQRQNTPGQINYLIRSFHTHQLEPSYARYLMPARNQYVEANLGSIPDALKFSANILKDLMDVDTSMRNKISIAGKKFVDKTAERNKLDNWEHPPSLSKYKIRIPQDSAIKNASSNIERNMRRARLSPEHRDYARINVGRAAQLRHPKPPNELFTAQHDRKDTELHEKHRRNRMKKLGLIETPANSEKEDGGENTNIRQVENQNKIQNEKDLSHTPVPSKTSPKYNAKISSSQLSNQIESKALLLKLPPKTNQIKEKKLGSLVSDKKETSGPTYTKYIPVKPNAILTDKTLSKDLSFASSATISKSNTSTISAAELSDNLPENYTITSPIAAARAQMPQKDNLRSQRYDRSDFFSTKRY